MIVFMSGIPPVTAPATAFGTIKFAIEAPSEADPLAMSVISFSCNDIDIVGNYQNVVLWN